MFFLLPILLTLPGHAAPPTVADLERNTLPTELQDWLPYLSQKHPEWACVATDNCQWPGLFNLSATAEGGHFSFGLRMDRAGEIALPGGRGAWPQQLQLRSYAGEAARPALVLLDRDGVPTLSLAAGVYRPTLGKNPVLQDRFRLWSESVHPPPEKICSDRPKR